MLRSITEADRYGDLQVTESKFYLLRRQGRLIDPNQESTGSSEVPETTQGGKPGIEVGDTKCPEADS